MEDTEKADSEPIPMNDDASPSHGKSCALCGCATPAVRCDRCNSQIFCLSCDDMYHRHPKRKLHLRKAVDSIWSTARSPRLRRRTELPGDPCKIPIPPPRSRKRERHTIGGRIFLKSGLELGSFGHSKVFDPKNLPNSKDFFTGQKSPASMVESNCDDETSNPNLRNETGQIYENDNVPASGQLDGNLNDRSPWNPTRPNISSPIQVSIPSSSPDIVANGQSFGYPAKPHSQSAADLTGHAGHPVGHHPYHFHPPYPYMHPPMHPYSHSMAHLNCAQCLSSSWSNLISPHPSPYFHPMPWGSAQNTMSRHPVPGPMKHSHGDLPSYPDSSFHYPYPGGGYYHNGPPVVDPNFIKDLHEQAEMQKLKKETTDSKPNPGNEEMDTTTNPGDNEPTSASNAATSAEAGASADKDAQVVDEMPAVPEKPTEPWSCIHCTFINPPGIYICQVCCKTSYGPKHSEAIEEQSEIRPQSRDSESPLVNRDALMNSPEVSEMRDAQKDIDIGMESELKAEAVSTEISDAASKLTTETQTSTTTKTTDAQTQNILLKSIASSTDSIFPKQEISVQTEVEAAAQNCSVATDPMISSQSLESLLSGVSAPPYHNRRAGWGRGATSFSTQSLYERGRSRSPMPRSLSFHTEAQNLGRDSSFASDEAVHSVSQAWLYSDPMYYKPHNQGLGQALTKEDYFDGTWGSMDKLNRRVKGIKDKGKLEHVRPKFHRSLDDLKSEKRPEIVHTQELMMLQTVKEAERCGFSLEDLHVAYLLCGKENPVYWLEDNWSSMIKNVIALAAKYGEDNEENDVGVITATEAREALRIHRGDIWDAVAECIENRQRKILELTVRGNFTQKQISEALKNNEGNVELAYADLLRASTRRHKFILSPGLSSESEDLNIYNPTEDTSTDHNVSVSPMKAAKLDVSTESKTEKKKSDFFTKLTAIREAQSERRKAREEKELIRETITQDFPAAVEGDIALKEKDISISREDSKEVEEVVQEKEPESAVEVEVEVEVESKTEVEIPDAEKVVTNVKEGTEDNIPVDFDTNWSESQGEWIEEYSDEQWEGDEQWVGLGKKFEKMEKEFEEEAMQMAALWEKEELEDDVFEDDTKAQKETEAIADSDKKFDEWVKANLKVDSSEYEEEAETKGKALNENITTVSVRERLELEGSQPSPLQHYPTEHDLSLKSPFESDWVDLPADAEIEKLAHDIVCEGSDVENKFDEAEMLSYEEQKPRKFSDQGSDEGWEKIEMDEQLQEVNELDQFAFPDKEGEVERNIEEFDQGFVDEKGIELTSDVSQITMEKDETVIYKNLEMISAADASDIGVATTETLPETADRIPVSEAQGLPSVDEDQPKPPVRRKSKLNSAAIEQALKNQAMVETSDIPPALPEKMRYKDAQLKSPDIYAMPDKTAKVSQEDALVSKEPELKDIPSVPPKPPRLNLSPLSAEERTEEEEKAPDVPLKIMPKDGSPVTPLSYESDSNFFADSESDTETKLRKQKNIHRKPAKYENEFEDTEMENISRENLEKMTLEEKSDILESNFDLELDEDIDPALIEPLPRMKDIDFDPELPILLGGRGRISDIEDVDAPKAFREDTTRPLQLFKATKKETPTNTLSMTSPVVSEHPVDESAFIPKASEELPISAATPEVPAKLPEATVYENQATERYYYNEVVAPQQSLAESQLPDKQETFDQFQPQQDFMNEVEAKQEVEQVIQPVSPVQEGEDEMAFTEMEGLSAAVDYFFGRYNEITVTRPKKKTPARAKPPTTASGKSAISSVSMSTSEITPVPKTETPSQMEQSAAAILQEQSQSESIPPTSDIQTSIPNQQIQKIDKPTVLEQVPPPPEKPKPVPSECLSFAEDYLFGCYNQVVVPRKTRNKPVVLATIPTHSELHRTHSPHKEQKQSTPTPVSTPEPPEVPPEIPPEEPEEEMLEEEVPEEEVLGCDENVIPVDTSVIYDEIFHDLPADTISNQSFDESSIYYESFQDAIEDVQSTPVDSSVVNVRAKTVHFEEPEVPVVPPRKNRPQGGQKPKVSTPTTSSESYANEYLFRQYEQVPQAKKKLPVCSEDFRMQQGFEPAEIPCDTPLMPDEQQEGVLSSEISVEIPSKSIESSKYSSEYEFEDSEQPLDSAKLDGIDAELMKTTSSFVESQNAMLCSENSTISAAKVSDVIYSDIQEDSIAVSTDIQSKKSESFEELSVLDQSEESTKSLVTELDRTDKEEGKTVSDNLSSTVTESHLNNKQLTESCDVKLHEPSMSSDQVEIDQFVFIEQTQDIIDDSYDLYEIQESLACDLNYIDVKGNIEDECTDDSEQEWKRNEDRKNTLNASFLNAAPSKGFTDEQEETVFDESEKACINESIDKPFTIDESKTEELNLEDQDESSPVDESYLEDTELTEITKKISCFPEESDDANIDDEYITTEVLDTKSVPEVSEAVEVDLEQKDSFTGNETEIMFESIHTENSEEIITKKISENVSDIDQKYKQKESSVTDEMLLDESMSTGSGEKFEYEEITEIESKIDQELLESALQPSSDYEIESEELNVISSVSEAGDLYITEGDYLDSSKESEIDEAAVLAEDLQMDMLEDLEASGELSDDNVSTHSSVSTQIAVSMKIHLKESEGDESSLNLEQCENLEDENEVSTSVSLPAPALSSKLQEKNIFEYDAESEDFEKLAEISKEVPSKYEAYEYETEDLDYEDKVDHKECKAELTPTPSFESEPQTEIYSHETDLEESVSVIKGTLKEITVSASETYFEESLLKDENISAPEDEQKEMEEITHVSVSELKADEISQSSFDENKDQFISEPSGYLDVFEKYKHEEEVADSEIISGGVTDEISIADAKLSDVNIAKETVSTDYNETNELQSDEIDSESLMDEEPIIMSHFYDEWYQSVEPSAKFTLLSAESIYAKYGTAESSESGSESDADNALTTVASEDVSEEAKISQKETLVDDVTLYDQPVEKDIKLLDRSTEELTLKKDVSDDIILHETTDIYEKSKSEDIYVTEFVSETDASHELCAKSKLELVQHDEQMAERIVSEQSTFISDKFEISSVIQEKTETVSIYPEKEESIQEIPDTKSVKSKFSTSKSCQTEDSFEEEIFFDSFDDTFTIPSHIHLPIEVQAKPPTSEISIQCELISTQDILLSQKIISSVSHTEVTTPETQAAVSDSPQEPNLREEQPEQSELASEEKEESSCESFEDTDSDIFIESPSSQDELDVGAKRGFLYAELDSDTGFSSGSECGWTKKSDKEKELKKTSQILVTKVHTQQISTSRAEKEISGSFQTYLAETSCDESQDKTIETLRISEESMAAEKIEKKSQKEYSEITSSDSRVSPLPSEIIERAITPIAVPQFPSFEDDLVFVEVEENIEEVTEDKQEEIISTTPTVEYFYGPLPETVKIESPPDLNERFFETASELSESVSYPIDRTESFSDSASSMPLSEQIPAEMYTAVTSVSQSAEDESFAETLSSLKGEIDESISEYYPLSESGVSLAENDFDLTHSEISVDNGFIPAAEYLLSDDRDKKLLSGKPSVSEIVETDNLTKTESSDKQSQEIISSVIISDSIENVIFSDVSTEIQSKSELDDQIVPDKKAEFVTSEKADEYVEPCETISEVHVSVVKSTEVVEKKETVDLRSGLSADISVSPTCEPAVSDIKQPSPDVPAVPSDIVRYLYYDDSVTFDDDSYHTQSENLEVPSLGTEEVQPVDSIDNVAVDERQFGISTGEVCTLSSAQVLSYTEEMLTSQAVYASVSDELVQESTETATQESQEIAEVSELNAPKDTLSETRVKFSEDITELSAEVLSEPEFYLPRDIPAPPEACLKFPTVEVIASENVTDLPAATEQIHEPVVHVEDQIPESVTALSIPFEDSSLLAEDLEFQDVVEPDDLKQSSPEIPHVPSDIVRYLYYDDDITFDETTQSSFHSQSENFASAVTLDDQPQMDMPEIVDMQSATTIKSGLTEEVETTCLKSSELHAESELPLAVKPTVSDVSPEESSYKLDSSSAKDESFLPLESSEYIDNWFDTDETSANGKKKHLDSEQQSSTKSSALKDSEQPCIPEYIMSPKFEGDMPVGKTDIDEVTDISTHFTMTDDSDKFSDIESDTSLNFEEECVLPIEMTDQIEVGDEKDVEMFESYVEEDDDGMNVRTPEVKDMPGGFQFITTEPLRKEFIEDTVPKESLEQEKFDECVTSDELSEQQSKEQFTECMTSNELPDQLSSKETVKEQVEEPKEKYDECITATDFSEASKDQFAECLTSSELPDEQHSKEIQEHVEEKFAECVTSVDSSELSKEQFAECLISSELVDQQFSKATLQERLEEEPKERFDECITSSEISEVSKEQQFTECLTSSELLDQQAVQQSISSEIEPDHLDKQIIEQLPKYLPSDENGNFPALITKEESLYHSADAKTDISSEKSETSCYISSKEDSFKQSLAATSAEEVHIFPEKLEVSSRQTETIERAPTDKEEDLETSCYSLPNEDSHSISTEVTDNWSDAESKNIEVDESIYDLPLEDNNIYSDVSILTDELREKFIEMETTSVESSQSFSSESKECHKKQEVVKADMKLIETAKIEDVQFNANVISEDVSDKFIAFIESEKSEVSEISDSFNTCHISEIKEVSTSGETNISAGGEKHEIITSFSISEQDSKQPSFSTDNLLSSDIKHISDVKMETESEISTAMKEKVHIGYMSATSGVEPTFSLGGTMYDTQEVESEKISSKGVQLSKKDTSECKISTSMEGIQVGVDIFESSAYNVMETKYMKISETETQYAKFTSVSDFVESDKAKINEVSYVSKDEVQNIHKKVEFVDFKGDFSVDNIEKVSEIIPVDTVVVPSDKKIATTETVDFKMVSEETGSLEIKIKEEKNVENVSFVDFKGQFGSYHEKQESETCSKTEAHPTFKDVTKKEIFQGTADSSETVDFKGCASMLEDHASFQVKESSAAISEKVDAKHVEEKKFICSGDSNIQAEKVDFKGECMGSDFTISHKDEETPIISKVPVIFDEKRFKSEAKGHSFEVVDFKGQSSKEFSVEKESVEFKDTNLAEKTDSLEIKIEEEKNIENVSFVDFKGQFGSYHEKQKSETCSKTEAHPTFKDVTKKEIFQGTADSSETVDFKGCASVLEDHTSFQMKESSAAISEKVDSKHVEEKKFICSSDSNIQAEKVDFKGEFMGSDFTISHKDEETSTISKVPVTFDEKRFKSESRGHSFEVVDFKGQSSKEFSIEKESVEFKDTNLVEKKLTITDDSSIKLKVSSSFETVDFKGQLSVSSDVLEIEKDSIIKEVKSEFPEKFETTIEEKGEVDAQTKVGEFSKFAVMESKDYGKGETDAIFETVDFKGLLTTDKQELQREEIHIQKDLVSARDIIETKVENSVKVEELTETIDFKGRICPTYLETEKQENEFDVMETSVDYNQTFYSDNICDTSVYDTPMAEIYRYDVTDQALKFDPWETYDYGISDQAVAFDPRETYGYGIDEQPVTFETQQQIYHDEIVTTEPASYSDEFSFETISSAEDTSMQFYSVSDDLEDTLNVTSEEFTDVPSHLTSTESSDKWSDVEGDFSFEDAEFDRDKTPTRTQDEIGIPEKEEFEEAAFDIMGESQIVSKSVEVKDESVVVFDEEKDTTTASETGVSDFKILSQKEDIQDFKSDLQKFETVSDLREITEMEHQTFIHEETKKSDVTLETSKYSFECKSDDVVSKQSEIKKSVTEDAREHHHIFSGDTKTGSIKELEVSSDQEISHQVNTVLEHADLPSTEKSTDISVDIAVKDHADVTPYQLLPGGSVKLSDVESKPEKLEKVSEVFITGEDGKAVKIITGVISDQIKSDGSIKALSEESFRDSQIERVDTEVPLTEHFADIRSLKDQSRTAATFSSFDAETAVPKTHEDTSTATQFQKSESEHWLEAETEHSISEVGEEIAFSIEKDGDTKVVFVEYEKPTEEGDTTVPSSQLYSETAYPSTTSSSSSYSDLENSDQTSDTCADISLQGATTENSDKWSDIETEGLIDDVLYGSVDITETAELTDFSQLIRKPEESKETAEILSHDDQLKTVESSLETTTESMLSDEMKSKDVKIHVESKLLKSASSFEGPDSTSVNLTDSGQSSIPTESSSLLSTPSAVTTIGLSDDELTNVTPLDVATEESDKWSDISGDTSLEEIDDESSVSLKASLKLQDQESGTVASEFKIDLSKEVKESESVNVEFKVPKTGDFVEKVDEKSLVSLKVGPKKESKESDTVSGEFKVDISGKEKDCAVVETSKTFDLKHKVSKAEDSIEGTVTFTSAVVSVEKQLSQFHKEQETTDIRRTLETEDKVDEESSISLKALPKIEESKESDAVSGEFKVDISRKEQDSAIVETSETFDLKPKVSKAEDSVEESVTFTSAVMSLEEQLSQFHKEQERTDSRLTFKTEDKIDEESLISLKTGLKIEESKESDTVCSEFKVDVSRKEQDSAVVETSEIFDLKPKGAKADDSVEETVAFTSTVVSVEKHFSQLHKEQETTDSRLAFKTEDNKKLSESTASYTHKYESYETSIDQVKDDIPKKPSDEEHFLSFKTECKLKDQKSDAVSDEFMLESSSLVTEKSDDKLKSDSQIKIESATIKEMKQKETFESFTKEKIEIESSVSSKITDESETLDSFTDVPTHNLTSEISDAYCELESDHSFEEIESPQTEAEETGLQDVQEVGDTSSQAVSITAQTGSEYYENALENEEFLENAEDFVLDAIPENELEHYEEEEYSLSEHFEINEDELIYPLPYNDDWIEQSFELKEYGVEAVFSESGSDIHGIGIGSEEYDDEDIQRAVDYNLSTFVENEDNVENVGATESFKTLSNEPSPHLKPEEFDTWSTADAPSIEEELAEQDSVLSKIDELLAEDFADLDTYQTESPLKHEEDIESYLPKDNSTPDKTVSKDLTEMKDSSLPKDTLLHIDKDKRGTMSETASDLTVIKKDSEQVLKAESDSVCSESEESKTIKKDKTEIFKTELETGEISIKDDSVQVFKTESKTVSDEVVMAEDFTKVLKTESETTSGEVVMAEDFAKVLKTEYETTSGEVVMAEDFTQVLKTESETLSSEITLKKDITQAFETEADAYTVRKESGLSLETSKEIPKEPKIFDSEASSSQLRTLTSITKSPIEETETTAVICGERKALRSEVEEFLSSSEAATPLSLPSDELCEKVYVQSAVVKDEQEVLSVEADASFKLKSDIKGAFDDSKEFLSTSEDASASFVLSSKDSGKQIKDQISDSATLSVSETDSSFDIPSKKLFKSTETYDEFSIKARTSSEVTECIQSSQQLSESLKHSVTSAAETVEVQSNIPDQRAYKDEMYGVSEQSVSLTHTLSKEQSSSDSLVVEVKPDIPKKTKRRSVGSKEGTPIKDEFDIKPSLPPKKSKRHSVSDSPSSSFGESLSSSSSVESIGSFESAVSEKSRKGSLKSSDETNMHSVSPEVPARRSRSSRLSSSRSTSRDSDDSSAHSRSSSLKIRRRSSNFIEPEPIDLSKRKASIDERMRKLQNEGKCTTKEKAFIAAKLIEMQFEEEDALLASRQCNTVYHAVKFLTQLCEMCNCRFPINLMSSMVDCTHRACKECLKAHFTPLIYDRSVFTLLCPICHKPDITDQNIQEYFNHLDMVLRNILEDNVYDLYQRKLRDEVLTKDPNFHWCSQCSSGFIASPRLKKLYCPDCSAITCAMCHQTWEMEHEGVHCERFQQWKDMHTPEPPPAGTVKFLIDRGVSCPSCGLLYAQACGGCLMYKCSHCSFEFCGFCIRPLKRGRECSNEICDSRGLHIHHLHNCLFFLRDKDITEIQILLEEESISYLTIPPKDQIVKSRCQVREQKNIHGVLSEDRCGRAIEPYCGGLCRTHYYEYLAELLRKNNISSLSIMNIQDLQFMLRKSRVFVPEKIKGEKSEEYYERLLQVVTNTLS